MRRNSGSDIAMSRSHITSPSVEGKDEHLFRNNEGVPLAQPVPNQPQHQQFTQKKVSRWMVIAIVFSCLLSIIAIMIASLKTCSCNKDFAAVAISGKYSDLLDRPDLKGVAFTGQYNDLLGKPQLATVATSGVYSDLQSKPNLITVGFSGNYEDLIGKPTLSRVATSGNYNDLQGTPQLNLHPVALSGNYNDLGGKPIFSPVATSGNYNDLQNRPTVFSGNYVDLIGRPVLSRVATSGNYSDLQGIPQPINFPPVALSGNYNDLSGKPTFSQVAITGNYNDLQNRPIGVGFSGNYDDLIGKPALSRVATSGNYTDLQGIPNLHPVAMSGNYNDLSGKPSLSKVATTGNYGDLQNTPTWIGFSGNYNDLIGKPILSKVATTGNYSDLQGLPPASPTLHPVAISGNYNDLQNKPMFAKVATSGNYSDLQSTPTKDIIVFTNWGRSTCPQPSNRLLYIGQAAGNYYTQGGGADILCLPRDPEYSPSFTSASDPIAAHLYGVEMDINFPPLATFFNKEMLCTVCEEEAKAVIIIYAKLTCPANYTKQYTGWAVAGLPSQPTRQWICLNTSVESYGSGVNDDQSILYIVDTQCGSLPCGPFIPNAEVSCVVCTRN